MSVQLSANFYKATISRFERVIDDPMAFPILLGFLEKASQNAKLLRGAKSVVNDDAKFKDFYRRTRDNLPPQLVLLIKKQEEKLRESHKEETEKDSQPRLEAELTARKEYASTNPEYAKVLSRLETLVASQLEILSKLDASNAALSGQLTKVQDELIATKEQNTALHERLNKQEMDNKRERNADKLHRNIAYAVSAISLAVGVFGVAVSWPGVVDELTGHKSGAGNNGGLQIRLASSGQCQPSDVRIEVKKDGTPTLPTSGSVCLVVPNDPTAANGQTPTPLPPNGGANDPLIGRSWLDMLNDGQAVKLFKQDGSSICVRMPKPLPCVGAEALPVTTSQIQKAPSLDKRRVARHGRRYLHHRSP
jgi:hypothetical protein